MLLEIVVLKLATASIKRRHFELGHRTDLRS
jgi:hypothetical protein